MKHLSGTRQRRLRFTAARALGAALLAGILLALAGSHSLPAQQVHQNGFESRDPCWVKGKNDAPFKELAHQITKDTAHSGEKSEFISIVAEPGSSRAMTSTRTPTRGEHSVGVRVGRLVAGRVTRAGHSAKIARWMPPA